MKEGFRNQGNATQSAKTGKKMSFRKKLLYNLLAMAIMLVVLVVAASYCLRDYTCHGKEIDVPDLKGMTTAQAVASLEKIGLRATLTDSVYVKSQRPNTIYSQSLSPGTHVKEGRIIHLTVNTDQPPTVVMPDIADNSSLREAMMRLTMLGLIVLPQEYVNGEKDWVYAVKVNGKNVTAGDRVPSDGRITLVVGDGTYFNMDGSGEMEMADDSMSDFGSDMTPL